MKTIDVLNQTGAKVEEVELNKNVFGVKPNENVVYDAVQVYMSNCRQATAKTKKRDEVSGGGRKPWRQKGTGRARQGSIRSPQWRGGGIVFGPTGEQNFKIKQNRKEARLALKSSNDLLRRSCAEYNIAVACYMMGEYELASEWLDRSDKDNKLPLSDGLRKRIDSRK